MPERVIVRSAGGGVCADSSQGPSSEGCLSLLDVVTASTHLGRERMKEINTHDLTWSLSHEALRAAVDPIWARIVEKKIPVSDVALVRLNATQELPYHLRDSKFTMSLVFVSCSQAITV